MRMNTLSELIELNIEQLPNKLDTGTPYTIIADVKHYPSVLKSIEKGKKHKVIIFITDKLLQKEHLTDVFNVFLISAEDKKAAMACAQNAKVLSSRIYIVR
jgi:hypothetical protein